MLMLDATARLSKHRHERIIGYISAQLYHRRLSQFGSISNLIDQSLKYYNLTVSVTVVLVWSSRLRRLL